MCALLFIVKNLWNVKENISLFSQRKFKKHNSAENDILRSTINVDRENCTKQSNLSITATLKK